MALELRQTLKLTQQLVMTPQLQMALKLLQMPRLELSEAVQVELRENPVLEELLDQKEEQTPHSERESLEEGKEKPEKDIRSDEINWDKYPSEFSSINYNIYRGDDNRPNYEQTLSRSPSLTDHLIWQLRLSKFTEEERQVGVLIIGNLDENGYLRISLDDVAQSSGVLLQKVEKVLGKIQEFDPVGVGARNLSECLLIQVRSIAFKSIIVEEIIGHHLESLQNNKHDQIARKLEISIEEVVEAAKFISGLEPKPGRAFSAEKPQYITPDMFVYKIDNDYVIVSNDDGLPKLQISPFYRRHLAGQDLSKSEKEYIQEKMRSAVWLIKSIHQRRRTIYRATESIMKFQREFLDKGVGHLKPLVLRDVAQDLEMSESTISRVSTNKYVHTPHGMFELKYFFNSGIQRRGEESIASESVKERIRKMIRKEDTKRPLSDHEIMEILSGENIPIARRTVAKYRNMLGVLPSNKRKRPF
jgi:RNA polymerase sigma-54 factor